MHVFSSLHEYLTAFFFQGAVTHRTNLRVKTVHFQWRTPSRLSGNIVFVATVVKDRATFWVKLQSTQLSKSVSIIHHCYCCMCMQQLDNYWARKVARAYCCKRAFGTFYSMYSGAARISVWEDNLIICDITILISEFYVSETAYPAMRGAPWEKCI
jgi:hypothetical protein